MISTISEIMAVGISRSIAVSWGLLSAKVLPSKHVAELVEISMARRLLLHRVRAVPLELRNVAKPASNTRVARLLVLDALHWPRLSFGRRVQLEVTVQPSQLALIDAASSEAPASQPCIQDFSAKIYCTDVASLI